MSDRREEILNNEHRDFVESKGVRSIYPSDFPAAYKDAALNAMDSYMKECCLELLEYMAKKGYAAHYEDGRVYFTCVSRGDEMTKEQVFENFL